MKLYKYRPISQLLFKELFYREIYLARLLELNDPLDMYSIIDFKSNDKKDIEDLVNFILHHFTSLSMESWDEENDDIKKEKKRSDLTYLFRFRKDEGDCNWLVDAINDEFTKCKDLVSINKLCEILIRLHKNNLNKLCFFEYIDGFRKEIERISDIFFRNSATACFSEINNDFLMWSHYATNHSGICLEYDLKIIDDNNCSMPVEYQLRSREKPNIIDIVSLVENVQKVKYVDIPYCTSFYEFLPLFANVGNNDLHFLSKSYWHLYAKKMKNTFIYKLKHWKYEKEWRMVRVKFKDDPFPEDRLLHYSFKALSGVIFGNRTVEEVKRRIYSILGNREVKYFNAAILNDSTIEVIPLDDSYFEVDQTYY